MTLPSGRSNHCRGKVDTGSQEKAKVFRNRLEGAEMVLDYLDMCGVPQNDEVYALPQGAIMTGDNVQVCC